VIKIAGFDELFNVTDCIKVGRVVLHQIDREIPSEGENSDIVGRSVSGVVDKHRRAQLQAHHTGTHLVFAACRNILGPHIWQAGAKKTLDQAHLDITHYKSLTKDEENAIENYANRLINNCHTITKGFMDKAEAEKQYGFSLYQGGVVPGNSLRVVDIAGVDTEACCGTHADNTAEVGWVRILKTQRISDGIVRLYYVAQERAIEVMNTEFGILNKLTETWGVDQSQIESTASRFFNEYKRLTA
jgi:alanyl-tRNA synthetase